MYKVPAEHERVYTYILGARFRGTIRLSSCHAWSYLNLSPFSPHQCHMNILLSIFLHVPHHSHFWGPLGLEKPSYGCCRKPGYPKLYTPNREDYRIFGLVLVPANLRKSSTSAVLSVSSVWWIHVQGAKGGSC